MGCAGRVAVIPLDERGARGSPAGVTRRLPGAKMLRAVEPSFVTIMFTDVVGSTTLYDRYGDDEADARRGRHFAVLREVVAAHEGREVKSTGDGLMVTFSSAVAAVRCAVALQRATTAATGGLDVRIGIDAGEPLSEGGDLYGTPVIVASRLCDAAGPGEILATEVVRQIAGPRVAELMRPAGSFRVKGISESVATALVRWREDDGEDAPPAREDGPLRPIRVVIADDQRLLRTGFRVILDAEPDVTVVGEAGDGHAAVDVVARRRPDVVLMDIRMPELDGLAAAERILADPENATAVVMLTTFDASEYVFKALRIGATGFLLKDTPSDRLLDAVRVAAAGEALIAPRITRRLIADFARASRPLGDELPPALAELTAREIEVLRLVAQGLSNAEIAAELVLGENTIKTHVGRLLGKLQLRDRVQAVVLAYETGLVTPDVSV
jgi:DNA-binding NarL/FixJ family response regulator/class 3 adenylate cyclase